MDELKKKYSDKLEQEISFNPRTGVVYCSDGVQYTPQEMAIIKAHGGDYPKEVHLIKKIFDGVIIS
jgi:hypothetical protein